MADAHDVRVAKLFGHDVVRLYVRPAIVYDLWRNYCRPVKSKIGRSYLAVVRNASYRVHFGLLSNRYAYSDFPDHRFLSVWHYGRIFRSRAFFHDCLHYR